MLAWLLWQLERVERIHAAAGVLMSEFGAEAGGEARRREREANSAGTARDWRRVAAVIARRSPKTRRPRRRHPQAFGIWFSRRADAPRL